MQASGLVGAGLPEQAFLPVTGSVPRVDLDPERAARQSLYMTSAGLGQGRTIARLGLIRPNRSQLGPRLRTLQFDFPGLAGAAYRNQTDDLRITSMSRALLAGFKARASFMFTGCCWRRPLAVDGGSGASRGHARTAWARSARPGRPAVTCCSPRRRRPVRTAFAAISLTAITKSSARIRRAGRPHRHAAQAAAARLAHRYVPDLGQAQLPAGQHLEPGVGGEPDGLPGGPN